MTLSDTLHKKMKNPLITGTLLLTLAGVASRIIGFFYRIFLSRTIGAESLGLYQLTFPLLALCLSLTSSGIQTALSRFVAEGKGARRYFYTALFLSCGLSLLVGALIANNSSRIAAEFLGDPRCADLLFIMSFSLLPAAVHACVNGYYYGLKKAAVPSVSQLFEQFARVGGVYLMYNIQLQKGEAITAVHAMWGIVIGEIFGLLYSVTAMWLQRDSFGQDVDDTLSRRRALQLLCSMAVPLTFNRVLINLCASVENMLIPKKLCEFGLSNSDALSVYGVLTGMSLSIILFPNVVTNSLSVLLLPAVSEANAKGHEPYIIRTTKRAILYGLLLGTVFTVIFLLWGNLLGTMIFHSPLAGEFIRQLSFLCPFMFVTGMLSSILHGLGRAKTVLFINLMSCLLRIFFVIFLVPQYGIYAYLWSLFLSQLFAALSSVVPLRRWIRR